MMDLGGPGIQVGLHHFLPRWSAEDSREEDLWGLQSDLVSLSGSASWSKGNGYGRYDSYWGFEHCENIKRGNFI